jgi:hypothetical protein
MSKSIDQAQTAKSDPSYQHFEIGRLERWLSLFASEFTMAPDEWADFKVMPGNIHTLMELMVWMRSARQEVGKIGKGIQDTTGKKRAYKNILVAVHAIHMSPELLNANDTYVATATNMARMARTRPPAKLSTSGKMMWTKTLEDKEDRIINLIIFILSCAAESARRGEQEEGAASYEHGHEEGGYDTNEEASNDDHGGSDVGQDGLSKKARKKQKRKANKLLRESEQRESEMGGGTQTQGSSSSSSSSSSLPGGTQTQGSSSSSSSSSSLPGT